MGENIMELVNLTEKEFENYSKNHALKNFVQTKEMGEIRSSKGWDIHYLGLKDNNKILGASLIVSKKRFLNKKEFYAPRGFLIDYSNYELVTTFVNEVKKYIKKNNGFKLRIDPYIIYKQRDISGKIVENGVNNEKVVELLKQLGFTKCKNDEQLKWLYALDIDNKTEDEILKNMSSNTRNIIRKTLKTNIKLRELDYDELELFEKITDETSSRRGFEGKDLKYYQQMKKLFKDNVLYVIADINLKDYINTLNKELESVKTKLNKLTDVKANEGKKKELNVTINSLDKKIKNAEELMKTDGETLILSGAMFMVYGDEIVYLFCGNYKKYMNFNAQYFIQWEMIKYGIKNNYKRYNFYGISGNFDKNDPSYGIYEFKKGFGGYVMELLGDYECGVGITYKIYNFLKGIKK